ncbi:adenosylcobinamide-GDP ribazoletransferase [Komagataeibacter medellinensis]|uniref:Adenosylcobinamide-GDP ribazoletransferase n=1 Tax=Komagataeibacter medellinensis (strain NBRC 3288 / BCRC 11682 / LMG 1693 / Kondo 51) TaxID=634177 RepID=G2I604_KOMMN|nr:adenosylcobinamide-GDP ribazoletransferase [Komagataeibacter medellinensis]BAK83551.1 cobalamin (5'-phosphate) synthase [Komagataeibacter medellinensis NBRC 3288]
MSTLARLRADLACGIGLLSRLPTGWLGGTDLPWSMPRSIWCWPLVGAVLGAAGALTYASLRHCGIAALPGAGWAISLQLLLCGGLHEDGLADMADGCGGGHGRAHKLKIMRDSRVGSYGVMALVVAILVRVGALAAMPGATALVALPAAGALARAAMVGVLWRLPPARSDGLASTLHHLPATALVACLCMAGGLAAVLLPGTRAVTAVAVAVAATGIMCRLARWQLGGQTGDVLGATAAVTECAILTALS